MSRRRCTLDVSPTSTNRVKVRCCETRPLEAAGNILLVQGQLDVRQFQTLERVFLAGAAAEGAEVSAVGRHYSRPGAAEAMLNVGRRSADERRTAVARRASPPSPRIRLVDDTQPRAPWLTGPIIGPHGVVEEDGGYDALARLHVERLLQRRRAKAIAS